MNTRFQKFLIFLFFLAASFSLLTSFAPRAQAQSTSLSISPPVVEILLAPNKQVKQTFTLQVNAQDIAIIPSIHRIKPADKSGHSEIDLSPIIPSSLPLTIKSSIPLDKPYNLTTNSVSITLTLEAATLDIAQDVYLALVIQVVPQQTDYTTLSPTLPGISALILTTINPTGVMSINLEIQNFDLPLIHDTWNPWVITPELKNSVDQMIHPEGSYQIVGPTGKTVLSRDLYPSLILGNSSRTLLLKPEDESLDPTPLTHTLKWSNIGPHRIKLLITTQGGTKLTEVERIVWFLPLRLLTILTVIVLVALSLYLQHRRKHKNNLNSMLDNNARTQ